MKVSDYVTPYALNNLTIHYIIPQIINKKYNNSNDLKADILLYGIYNLCDHIVYYDDVDWNEMYNLLIQRYKPMAITDILSDMSTFRKEQKKQWLEERHLTITTHKKHTIRKSLWK